MLTELTMKSRRGFTLVEMLVVIAILGLLMSILIPSLGRAKEAVRQTKCRSQLRGFGNSLHSYAAEMSDKWPCVLRPNIAGQQKVDTSASLWLLVVHGNAMIGDFVCPTDEVANRATAYRGIVDPAIPFPLQDNKLTLSYSYQVPHSVIGGPGQDHPNPTHFAVMADRNPFDPPGSTPPPGGQLLSSMPGWSSPSTLNDMNSFIVRAPASDRMTVNSVNHNGDGQSVLYRDGHVEWWQTPLAGINGDNIYTRQNPNDNSLNNLCIGNAPDDTSLPGSNDDSYLRTVHPQ